MESYFKFTAEKQKVERMVGDFSRGPNGTTVLGSGPMSGPNSGSRQQQIRCNFF
jgi:hypothetical protein